MLTKPCRPQPQSRLPRVQPDCTGWMLRSYGWTWSQHGALDLGGACAVAAEAKDSVLKLKPSGFDLLQWLCGWSSPMLGQAKPQKSSQSQRQVVVEPFWRQKWLQASSCLRRVEPTPRTRKNVLWCRRPIRSAESKHQRSQTIDSMKTTMQGTNHAECMGK